MSEDSREYYAISKDFNLDEAWNRYDLVNGTTKVYWIRDNVLLPIYRELVTGDARNHIPFTYRAMKNLIDSFGKTNKEIAQDIDSFVGLYDRRNTKFYGYYSDYDWVVFCWLFGRMIDLPKCFPMYCIDLKQELDRKANTFMPLDDLKKMKDYPKQVNEHNALADARWNRDLYDFIELIS